MINQCDLVEQTTLLRASAMHSVGKINCSESSRLEMTDDLEIITKLATVINVIKMNERKKCHVIGAKAVYFLDLRNISKETSTVIVRI